MIFMQFHEIEFQFLPLRLSFQFEFAHFPFLFFLVFFPFDKHFLFFIIFQFNISIERDTKWGNWILKQYYIIISVQSNAAVVAEVKL